MTDSMFFLAMFSVLILGLWVDSQSTISKQRDKLYLADKYIRRLKQVAQLKGCDLSGVKDDRYD